ncbi:probable glutathione S-transferase [Henckelia pumila]|uniref:probable glutathione S-transferase n=1 Tax=Henckelia pumila TaxID=405737 RepID=UPI003C6E3C5B
MAEVKLFGFWGSPYSRRVEMALKLKGVEYEYIEEDIIGNKSPRLLQYNPVHKKVPLLLHNGMPIAESLVILEYIDETWKNGQSILPNHPHDRALARFWAKFLDETCWRACKKAYLSGGKEQVKAKEEAEESLKLLDNELKGKKFFGGDSIGLVDIAANLIAYWPVIIAEIVGVELITNDKFPNLCAWMDEYLNSNVVKEHLPDRDKLAEHIRTWFQKTSPVQ